MTRFPLRRAHLFALLTLAALLLLAQFRTPTVGRSGQGGSPDADPNGSQSAQPAARDTFADIDSWYRRYERSPDALRPALLRDALPLLEAQRETFLKLMREKPAAALEQALSLAEVAALPPELAPYFARPFSGVGSIDLRWKTNLQEDGSLRCRHEHVLFLDQQTFALAGPSLEVPTSPRKDVPVSGIALGKTAVLAPSAVRRLAAHEWEPAARLFPTGNPNHLDPVSRQPGHRANAALIGGKIYQFESPTMVDYVAGALVAAEEEAEQAERYEVRHAFAWLEASGGGVEEGEPPVDATPFMDDTIDVLFIRVDFSDFPGAPVPQGALETTLSAVQSNVETFSYNAATIVPTVTPTVYRMPSSGASYATAGDNNGIQTDARALAAADYTIANYDVIAVFFPSLSGVSGSQITYGGLASIGGSNHWINGVDSTSVILHEFGHNYGLRHANYWDITQTLPGDYDVPFSREYGDIFDVMGSGLPTEGHFNHYNKNLLDWMPDSKVAEPIADGTFRIYRFDHPNALANPTLAVKVPMGGDVYYWIGYRQLYTSPSYNLDTGAYIVAEGLSEGTETNLIDATPGSASPESADREDCGLEIGTPFVDSGVTFTALARGGSAPNEWIDVNVAFAARVGLVETNVAVDEQSGTAWLTLQRQFSTTGIASVDFATSDGSATAPSDYYATAGTVTWPDGDSSNKTIAIPIRPDALAEGTETFTLTLSNPTGASLDALASVATVSLLDPGARCPTFSPAFFNSTVHSVIPLSNGQILMGGHIQDGSGDLASVKHLARLNADGSADATLDTGTGFNARVRALAVQPDGKIIAGGDFTSYDGTACAGLIRLNPDGSIDTNIGGVDNGTVYSLAIESDGKILVGGSFNSFDGTTTKGMVRLTAAGSRDTGSPLALPFTTPWSHIVYAIVVQPDNQIMVAGSFYIAGGGEIRSGVARLNPDGTRDTSFTPGGGTHALGAPTSLRSVYSLATQPDGKYLIGGFFTAYDNNAATYLARIDADGTFDSSFTAPAFPGSSSVQAVALQPDGKVVVGLSFTLSGPNLTRLNSDGSTDSSFDVGTGPEGTVYSLAQLPTGMLYVGGNYFDFDGQSSRPITKIAGGTRPYDFWALANFTAAQLANGDADPGADPDGDGSNNAAERALGTNPNLANGDHVFGPGSAGTASLHESGGNEYLQISLTKSPDNTGAWYLARFTGDLTVPYLPNPPQPGSNAVYDVIEDSATTFTVRDKTPLGTTGKRFVKIGIMQPD